MASIHTSTIRETIRAERNEHMYADHQAVVIRVGDIGTIFMSREEAAHLAADLLNAADAVPGDVEAEA